MMSNLTSAIALAVSVFALAIGAWQTRLMQSQARASVWPHLEIGYTYNSNVDENAFLWRVDNNGVGPARIETVRVTFDGTPLKNWEGAAAALGFKGPQHYSTSSLDGEVIPPSLNRETAIEALRVNQRELAAAIKQNATRFGMDICYCSVYDDCWIAHWLKTRPEPVARCEDIGTAQFGD